MGTCECNFRILLAVINGIQKNNCALCFFFEHDLAGGDHVSFNQNMIQLSVPMSSSMRCMA
jgi:hypothetical protein